MPILVLMHRTGKYAPLCRLVFAAFVCGFVQTGVPAEEATETDPAVSQDVTSASEQGSDSPESVSEDRSERTEHSETMQKAIDYYFDERYHIALRLFQRVLDEEPENRLAYLYAGDIYLLEEDFDEARRHYLIARDLSASPEEENFRLGQLHLLRNDAANARQAFFDTLDTDPTFHLCHFYLGLVSYRVSKDLAGTTYHWQNYARVEPEGEQTAAIERAVLVLQNPDFSLDSENEDDANADENAPADEASQADGDSAALLPGADDARVRYRPGRESDRADDSRNEPALLEIDEL